MRGRQTTMSLTCAFVVSSKRTLPFCGAKRRFDRTVSCMARCRARPWFHLPLSISAAVSQRQHCSSVFELVSLFFLFCPDAWEKLSTVTFTCSFMTIVIVVDSCVVIEGHNYYMFKLDTVLPAYNVYICSYIIRGMFKKTNYLQCTTGIWRKPVFCFVFSYNYNTQ